MIIGDYAEIEFGRIKTWSVDEKVDGTNIRIFYKDGGVSFGGRTSAAQLPCHLLKYLQDTFTKDVLSTTFPDKEVGCSPNIIIFGEGYGPKIQACGGNYRNTPGFILFDVFCQGWWLTRESCKEVADSLQVPMVPFLGVMTEDEIVEYVKSKPMSLCSEKPQVMEGFVVRSDPLMLFRNGKQIMWKLKCCEFA